MSTVTIATKIDEDSELVKQFNEYKEANSMNSKSEAMRALLRAGIKKEYIQDDSGSQDDEPSLKDALSQAGLLNRRFFGYAIFGFVAGDIYDLMASVGTYFVSLGTVNLIFTAFALLVFMMFIIEYVIRPSVSTIREWIGGSEDNDSEDTPDTPNAQEAD